LNISEPCLLSRINRRSFDDDDDDDDDDDNDDGDAMKLCESAFSHPQKRTEERERDGHYFISVREYQPGFTSQDSSGMVKDHLLIPYYFLVVELIHVMMMK
jgi:hypothetical protein